MILMAARQGNWNEIDRIVREFQAIGQRFRYSQKPVAAVPFGMALGGGCEICLACPRRVAAMESYMGLVEVGVGLIPAGGGCKNLMLQLEKIELGKGPQPKVSRAFQLIATSQIATSARAAKELGFIAQDDIIVMDREFLIDEARRAILKWAKDYVPPDPEGVTVQLPGRGGEMVLVDAARSYVKKGKATEYDAFIAGKLAHVLAGGDKSTVHEVTEEHILDLEREAFMSLVGEEKTQARMEHMLKTGKPLRN
jgi:3-hydroxyacyl-CoA dehydrogenase